MKDREKVGVPVFAKGDTREYKQESQDRASDCMGRGIGDAVGFAAEAAPTYGVLDADQNLILPIRMSWYITRSPIKK
jgi:hypothetical protein